MRYVPTDEFAPVLRRLVGDEPTTIVAERAEVPFDSIDAILRQRRRGCDFNIADRLLCALGGQHLWWGELAHIYYAIELERTCEAPACKKKFVPNGHGQTPKYCSTKCRVAAAHSRRHAERLELQELRKEAA